MDSQVADTTVPSKTAAPVRPGPKKRQQLKSAERHRKRRLAQKLKRLHSFSSNKNVVMQGCFAKNFFAEFFAVRAEPVLVGESAAFLAPLVFFARIINSNIIAFTANDTSALLPLLENAKPVHQLGWSCATQVDQQEHRLPGQRPAQPGTV